MSIAIQKYLGVVIDNEPSSHISALCKKMAHYLYLIGCHQSRNLSVAVLKILIQSLVLSHLRYAMPVWGPSLSHDLQSRPRENVHRAVRVVYGLRKFDHVSALRRKLEWLSIQSLIQHHRLLMLYRHYHAETENTILLIHQFNLADNHIMRPELPLILLFHVDLDFHYSEIFLFKRNNIFQTK